MIHGHSSLIHALPAVPRCLCKLHYTYRTVKAVNDDPRALMCPHVECLACSCSPYLACSCSDHAYESPDAKADALWCDTTPGATCIVGKSETVAAALTSINSCARRVRGGRDAATQLRRPHQRRVAARPAASGRFCVCRALGLHVQTKLELHCGRLLRPYARDVVLAEVQCLDLHRLTHLARRTVSHVMVDFYIAGVRVLAHVLTLRSD